MKYIGTIKMTIETKYWNVNRNLKEQVGQIFIHTISNNSLYFTAAGSSFSQKI